MRDYCPRCRLVTNLAATITPTAISGPDGKPKTILVRSYHCESCGSFVRSEEESLQKDLATTR